MPDKNIHFKKTQYGFEWGNAKIKRVCDDSKRGWVILTVETNKYPTGIEIYVTRTGKVRIYSNGKEWFPIKN